MMAVSVALQLVWCGNYPVLEIRSYGITFGMTDARCWRILANRSDWLPLISYLFSRNL